MNIISLEELVETRNKKENIFMINNLLLNSTSIVLSAVEKVGKTTLITQLIQSIIENDNFLDIEKDSYNVDAILFFSNDSNSESILIKLDKMNFDLKSKFPIFFIFKNSITINEIETDILNKIGDDKRLLLIVDVLGGLRDDNKIDINDYLSTINLIDKMEKSLKLVTKSFGVIYLHHLNKSNIIMGSRGIASRVSATLTMIVDPDTNQFGMIDIKANDFESRKIYIKKNEKKHIWVLDKEKTQVTDKDVEYQLLRINEAISKSKNGHVIGNVNEVIALTRITIAPRKLRKWLKKNKKYLKQNNIGFEIKKSNTTIIDLYFIN